MMRKNISHKNREAEDDLMEIIEGVLPYEELEVFMEDNDLSKFSLELSRDEGGVISISSLYITE